MDEEVRVLRVGPQDAIVIPALVAPLAVLVVVLGPMATRATGSVALVPGPCAGRERKKSSDDRDGGLKA
ncbi:MAG TPA: hypothetical protein VMT11_00905 [Myxococcaceae bacterium]|nr:hypothetical protein [Myxococcaceae bacterium]